MAELMVDGQARTVNAAAIHVVRLFLPMRDWRALERARGLGPHSMTPEVEAAARGARAMLDAHRKRLVAGYHREKRALEAQARATAQQRLRRPAGTRLLMAGQTPRRYAPEPAARRTEAEREAARLEHDAWLRGHLAWTVRQMARVGDVPREGWRAWIAARLR